MKILYLLLSLSLGLTGCGGGASGSNSIDYSASRFSITATIAGLGAGKQVILNDGTNSITATSNTNQTFLTQYASNSTYQVSITSQPVGQTCTVSYGNGTITTSNISNVLVNCADNPAPTYSISFTVSGLGAGKTVIITDGIENKSVTTNSTVTFTNQLATNLNYSVTIGTQPNAQFCKVTNGSGTVNNANVSNIGIQCSTVYSFTGTNFVYTPNLVGIVSGATTRTYNTWIRLPSALNNYVTIIGQGTLNAYNRSALILCLPSTCMPGYNNGTGSYFLVLDFQVGGVWSEKFNIADTNWHMVTVTYDGTAAGTGTNFYLDGVKLSNPVANPMNGFTKASVNTINFNNSITIGGETYNGTSLSANTGFIGDIRNSAAWSAKLTDAEVTTLFTADTRPSTGLFFTKD